MGSHLREHEILAQRELKLRGVSMLKVKDLWANYEEREVLKGVNLEMSSKIALLLGPNGSGKTTLLRAIAGSPKIKVVKGKIFFLGKDVTSLPPYERSMLGIGLAHQFPVKIRSVKVREFLEEISKKFSSGADVEFIATLLGIEELLDRPLNYNFSGGEIKKVEIATLLAQKPKLALIDEPDSGVDVEGISKISLAIKYLVKSGTSCLIVTHTGRIGKEVRAELAFVMVGGRVVCRGNPEKILRTIEERGFSRCYKCCRGGEVYEVF